MGYWSVQLVKDFDRDFRKGAKATYKAFETIVQADPAMPRDTGKLAKGVKVGGQVTGLGLSTADVSSKAKSKGVDYPAIINFASGKTIVPKKKKALANKKSGWGPYASARQSTKHRGWYDKVLSQKNFDAASAAGLDPVDL